MTRAWADVVADIDAVIAILGWGQFLIVDYDLKGWGEQAPYAQAACGPQGWYAEVASDANVTFWRHDGDWLSDAGWHRAHADDNWQRDLHDPRALSQALVAGLHCGRGCLLPDLYSVRVGRFGSPPDGGVPQRSSYTWAA